MKLIDALIRPRSYPHPVESVRLIETHISWVLLTGKFVYKIKKPLDLGFLDFTTLERRRFYCEEELRLNQRLAPGYYLEVVPITGSAEAPQIGGKGSIIEYALKMRQFPAGELLSEAYAHRSPERGEIVHLARQVADFHLSIAGTAAPDDFGTAAITLARSQENFAEPLGTTRNADEQNLLAQLEQWTANRGNALRETIEKRKTEGFVRECHGDLHLGNIFLADTKPIIFDCIEFAADLRWIDVINDLAFLTMDLRRAGHPDAAFELVNRYLHITGDYAGLQLWQFYEVYRAMVRAKIAALRTKQTEESQSDTARREMSGYISLANALRQKSRPSLLLTHGFSGSGKSTLCQDIAPHLHAIWLRSDVERKRLHGLDADQASHSGLDSGIYKRSASETTYATLRDIARTLLAANYNVIVDATFLHAWQRQMLIELATEQAVPWLILNCAAPETTLRQWLRERKAAGSDPSEADEDVLALQLANHDPLTETEKHHVCNVDTSRPWSVDSVLANIYDHGIPLH